MFLRKVAFFQYFDFKYAVQIFEIILPVILYGCNTCSVTLRGENMLMVFDNGVLRKALGPEREKVAGYQRKLHYEELHGVHSSLNL